MTIAIPSWVPSEFHSSYRTAAAERGEEAAASIARKAKQTGRWPKRHGWKHRTHTLTPAMRSAMVDAYLEGQPASEIAKRFDVHPAYIRVAARRAGLSKGRKEPAS